MAYLLLHPAAAGGLGYRTKMDSNVEPPRIQWLHAELDSWFGDAVAEVFPCYVVTQVAGDSLENAELTGFELREMETTLAEDAFSLMDREVELPVFRWLHVTGEAGRHDIGLTGMSALVVSDRAFEVLRWSGMKGRGHEIYQE